MPDMRKSLLLALVMPALGSPFRSYLADTLALETMGKEVSERTLIFHLLVSAALVLGGGVFAGLTLGLMGLDELYLRGVPGPSERGYIYSISSFHSQCCQLHLRI